MNARAVDPATRALRIWRHGTHGRVGAARDVVAVEEPLELRVDTQSLAVLMRTPGHDEELAAGWLLSEGVVRQREDLRAIRPYARNRDGNVVDAFLSAATPFDLRRLSRHVFASSSCGVCGTTSVDAVCRAFPATRQRWKVAGSVLRALPGKLRESQAAFAATGGLHAAALFSRAGDLLLLREDVGRHNAVDKVVGRWWLEGHCPASDVLLLVSSRASFEILQKALAAGIALVATVGAPSSLAVTFARRSGQSLVGFLRDDRFNVYAGTSRIVDR